jgi:hypothetical protein
MKMYEMLKKLFLVWKILGLREGKDKNKRIYFFSFWIKINNDN